VDSKENMAKLVLQYVMLFIHAHDIVYLSRLQKSLKFAILVGKKSKICDFLFPEVPIQILCCLRYMYMICTYMYI